MSKTVPTALITGAAKRLGRQIAETLARAGYDIALHYNTSQTKARETAEKIRNHSGRKVTLIRADLANTATYAEIIRQTLDQHHALNLLVNNASTFNAPGESIEAFDPQQWERIHRINLIAPAALAHHAAPHLAESTNGSIVNITDISAQRPWPQHLGYCVSKAALIALTRGLARALAPNVRVNAVSPGLAMFSDHYDQKKRERIIQQVPLKREGTPTDIADAVLFLARSSYITGQVINVDGGRSIT